MFSLRLHYTPSTHQTAAQRMWERGSKGKEMPVCEDAPRMFRPSSRVLLGRQPLGRSPTGSETDEPDTARITEAARPSDDPAEEKG